MYNIGNTICWDITITNNGPDNNDNIIVTDLLDSNLSFISATISGTTTPVPYNATTGAFDLSGTELFNGDSISITLCAEVIGGAGTDITNTATVTSNIYDPDTNDNTSDSTVTILETSLSDYSLVGGLTGVNNGAKIDVAALDVTGGETSLTFTVDVGTWTGDLAATGVINVTSPYTLVSATQIGSLATIVVSGSFAVGNIVGISTPPGVDVSGTGTWVATITDPPSDTDNSNNTLIITT